MARRRLHPHTDGSRCDAGYDDYDGFEQNGCEAEPDDLAEPTELTAADPVVEGTIVPRDDVDRFVLPVDDRASIGCDGSLTITLTGPEPDPGTEGMTLQLYVTRGEGDDLRTLGVEYSAEGNPATVEIPEVCGRSDAGEIDVRVRPIGSDRSAGRYTLRRDGSF